MTAQAAEAAAALWARLQPRFDDTPRTNHVETAAGQHNWPVSNFPPTFGADIADVRSVVVHCTSGWPTHDKTNEFVRQYTVHGTPKAGIGPHFYMPHDGKVYRLLSENKVCWHATYVNAWAIGVETGNLNEVGAPTTAAGPWPHHWTPLSTDTQDLPGTKIYAISVNGEILVAYYTTRSAAAPADAHADGHVMMRLSEPQYVGWARLARWLAEVWRIPRNFPLQPYVRRGSVESAWRTYRAAVDADPTRDMHIRTQLQPHPYNCSSTTFESNTNAAGLPHVYAQGRHLNPPWTDSHGNHHPARWINDIWSKLFNSYRGFHAHSYSGAIALHDDDHNCPGAWFDWQRFARLVWDYWWYPFDLEQSSPADAVTSVTDPRDYGQDDGALHEHYFDDEPSWFAKVTTRGFYPVGEETVTPHLLAGPPLGPVGELVRMWRRYWGFWHGGMHFDLDAASPIYAMAGGQIVGARLGPPAGSLNRTGSDSPHPSALFVLLRHEVFFRRGGGDRIDYNQEPARVYSLYMHLGVPDALSYTEAVSTNPTWLNRVITIKKEYDLGQAFHGAHPAPAAQWVPHTTRWARQQPVFDQLIADLEAGNIVRFPEGEDAVRIALGDLLGSAGHLDTDKAGIHLEVFSAEQVNDAWFEAIDKSGAASRPFHADSNLDDVTTFINDHVSAPQQGASPTEVYRALPAEEKASSFQTIALRGKSEWALKSSDFPAGGWAVAKDLMWWDSVVPDMNGALTDARDRLPADGVVWHYHPLGFIHWLNGITWKSEWPKYRITDATGAAVPAPARPPPRT
ncbi:MAG TPA: N-acetylmuramoyl-L-alanine amidase [Steroidobacteraceae bacterium]|nr:N-acetylmuramoyl-L-alanine amidase [Steroidobacteraceae bacterium]